MTPAIERRQTSDYWWIKRFPLKEMGGELRTLKPEARCLVNDFRDFAFENNGLPVAELELIAIAETFRFTKYRFKRFWNGDEERGIKGAKNFFTQIGDRLHYGKDGQQSSTLVEISSKQSTNGKRGADVRWSDRGEQRENEVDGDPPLSPMAKTEDSSTPSLAVAVASCSVEEGELRGEGGRPPVPEYPKALALIATMFPDVTPNFLIQLVEVCRKVDPAVTEDRICEGLHIVAKEKQTSAGLFLKTLPAWISNHRTTKNFSPTLNPSRKPNTKDEAIANHLQRCMEFDRKAGVS
jgi:hypothetical protein